MVKNLPTIAIVVVLFLSLFLKTLDEAIISAIESEADAAREGKKKEVDMLKGDTFSGI